MGSGDGDVLACALWGEAATWTFLEANRLRNAGLRVAIDLMGRSMKAQMKAANRSGAAYAAMRTQVRVVSVTEYEAWLEQQASDIQDAQAFVQEEIATSVAAALRRHLSGDGAAHGIGSPPAGPARHPTRGIGRDGKAAPPRSRQRSPQRRRGIPLRPSG